MDNLIIKYVLEFNRKKNNNLNYCIFIYFVCIYNYLLSNINIQKKINIVSYSRNLYL